MAYMFCNIPEEKGEQCQYGDCKDVAIHYCNTCKTFLCKRHSRKGGLTNIISVYCPDCMNMKRDAKLISPTQIHEHITIEKKRRGFFG